MKCQVMGENDVSQSGRVTGEIEFSKFTTKFGRSKFFSGKLLLIEDRIKQIDNFNTLGSEVDEIRIWGIC